MSVRLCCVSVIELCYILCILQHFVQGGRFYPDTVYKFRYHLICHTQCTRLKVISQFRQLMNQSSATDKNSTSYNTNPLTFRLTSICNFVAIVKHRIKSETVHLSNSALQEHKFREQLICHSCPVWAKNDTTMMTENFLRVHWMLGQQNSAVRA